MKRRAESRSERGQRTWREGRERGSETRSEERDCNCTRELVRAREPMRSLSCEAKGRQPHDTLSTQPRGIDIESHLEAPLVKKNRRVTVLYEGEEQRNSARALRRRRGIVVVVSLPVLSYLLLVLFPLLLLLLLDLSLSFVHQIGV